jgi:hypothetical protein
VLEAKRLDLSEGTVLRAHERAQGLLDPLKRGHGARAVSADRAGRKPAILAVLWAGIASAGCAGQSSFLTGGPTVGQLKTSLSHLESENQQLKHSLAKLEQENRSIEDRLVQEQIDNGDLAARLDDARNLLTDRGVDPSIRVGSHRGGAGSRAASGEDDGSAPRTLRAGQRMRERRKPPFVNISGPVNRIRPIDEADEQPAAGERVDSRHPEASRSGRRSEDDLDHHSFVRGSLGWLPVTDQTGSGVSIVR